MESGQTVLGSHDAHPAVSACFGRFVGDREEQDWDELTNHIYTVLWSFIFKQSQYERRTLIWYVEHAFLQPNWRSDGTNAHDPHHTWQYNLERTIKMPWWAYKNRQACHSCSRKDGREEKAKKKEVEETKGQAESPSLGVQLLFSIRENSHARCQRPKRRRRKN